MTTTTAPDPVRRRWESDFASVNARIPEGWTWTDDDGMTWFEPGQCTCDAKGKERFHCLVHLHLSLARVGFARGWL